MRTGTGSSHPAAWLGVTIAAIVPRTGSAGPARLVVGGLALITLAVVAACGGSGGTSGGAALPARPAAATVSASPTSPLQPVVDDSPAAAQRTIEAYFREINAASRAGRLAATDATALAGCQPCALDIGVTRSLQQRGLHASADAYQVGDLSVQPRVGLVSVATFTVRTATVDLLDVAGRHVTDATGVPARTARAQLALTARGWRIESLRYAPRRA